MTTTNTTRIATCLISLLLWSGAAPAEDGANTLVQMLHAYCVETDGKAELIDAMMRIEKWEELSEDMVTIGQAQDAEDARGYMTVKDNQRYLLNYSPNSGCGLITQGINGLRVLSTIKAQYKVADTHDTVEGFQRSVMMVLSKASRYEGSVIVINFLPDEPDSIVSLAFLAKRLTDF